MGKTGTEIVRNYDEDSCRWIQVAKCMRGVGIPVEALVSYVAMCQQGDATHEARKQLLIDQRARLQAQLEEIQAALQRLDHKIEHYEQWSRTPNFTQQKE